MTSNTLPQTRDRTQLFAQLQQHLAGMSDRDIEVTAACHALRFVNRHSVDEVERAALEALRDTAGGMPTKELLTFAFHFGAELQAALRLREIAAA